MEFDYRQHPRRLNLGCGLDRRPGFLNVDMDASHHPDLVSDVTDLSMLPSGYYEHLLAQDVLEHIPRLRIRNTLKGWNRVLAPGGVLELRVPDVVGLLGLLSKRENRSAEIHEQLLQNLFGTQCYIGDFHYIGFTDVYIESLLSDSGFAIRVLERHDGWLFHILADKVAEQDVEAFFRLPDQAFIEAAYQRVLGRAADPEGFQHYLSIIRSGIAREAVVEALEASPERVAPTNGPPHG